MMSAEDERPLAALSAHEQSLAIERLKGDLRVLNAAIEAMDDARSIQATEYERRLSGLNHEAEQLKQMQARYTPRETYDRDVKETDTRLRKLENQGENLAGKLWLPMLMVAGIAAGLAAVMVKTMFP